MKKTLLFALAAISYFTSAKAQFEDNWSLHREDFPAIVAWMEQCQNHQIYQEEFEEHRKLWTKTSNGYMSKDIIDNYVRTSAHEDDVEDYSEPFQGLLHQPVGTMSITLTSSTLTLEFLDKIQVASSFNQSTGAPKAPHDGATATFGCTSGTRTLSHETHIYGKDINVTYTTTCSHSSVKKNIAYGGRVNPFSPYIQTHTQKVTYNLDAIAKGNGLDKKELVTRMILRSYLALPLGMGEAMETTDGYALFNKIDLCDGIGLDHAVLIFMIWKQFGITEEYLNEIIRKGKKDVAAHNADAYFRKVAEKIPVLDAAQAALHDGRQFDPTAFFNAEAEIAEIQRIAQKNQITDLVSFIAETRARHASLYVLQQATYGEEANTSTARNLATMHQREYRDPKECCDVISNICGFVLGRDRYKDLLVICNIYEMIIDELTDDEKVKHANNFRSKRIYALSGMGHHDDALTEALDFKDETNTDLSYTTLCMVYVNAGQKEKAMETYGTILERNPQYAQRNTRLNMLLRNAGWID